MSEKEKLVGSLLEAKHITFEQALLLLKEDEYFKPISVPYHTISCTNGGFYSDTGTHTDTNGNCIINN
jgi:hypothetical protein